MTTPIAVTIAGSDTSGGAGIQADLKTFSALGVYGASVIAALTAQNTKGVTAIHDVPPDFVTAQIDAVFSDLAVGAVKIGMLSQAGVIEAVASGLRRYKQSNIVLDPVMIATSGDRLLAPQAVAVLRDVLMKQALIITPNLPEAAALLETTVAESESEMQAQGEKLLALGARAVLIKGGHGSGAESVDILVEPNATARLAARAHRYQQHARHGLHIVVGHCRRPRQGSVARRSRAAGQGLCHCGDRGLEPASQSAMATARCIIFIIGGMGTDHEQDFPPLACWQRGFWCRGQRLPRRRSRAPRPRAGAW